MLTQGYENMSRGVKRQHATFEPDEKQLIERWIEEQRTESTKHAYQNNIDAFRLWYGKPLTDFLKLSLQDMRSVALKFQGDCQRKKIPANTTISFLAALGSFCTWNGKTLMLKNKRLRTQIDLSSHKFSNGDLTQMFDVGNVEQKAILSTFVSLGWEVSAILNDLDRKYILGLIERAKEENRKFVYFQSQRGKTGALRLGVLNPLALGWLDKWLHDERSQTMKTLFTYTTKEGINSMLKHLARDAHITKLGRVHSHLIRKWVMSGLSRAKFNEFQIKYILGKAIPVTDATYLLTLQEEIEDYYPEAYEKFLNIRATGVHVPEDMRKENENLKDSVSVLKNEMAAMKDQFDSVLEKLKELKELEASRKRTKKT